MEELDSLGSLDGEIGTEFYDESNLGGEIGPTDGFDNMLSGEDGSLDDHLSVSEEDLSSLEEKSDGLERSESSSQITFGRKMCPSRHGCQGATDCDYAYGGYPG